MAKAPAKHVAKVRAQPGHRATALLHHAAMVRKAPRALKAKAMAAVKAVAARSNVAIRVLTTVVMAKAVPHHAVHVLKAVVQVAAHRAAMAVADTQVAKTVAETMAMSCHATLTP